MLYLLDTNCKDELTIRSDICMISYLKVVIYQKGLSATLLNVMDVEYYSCSHNWPSNDQKCVGKKYKGFINQNQLRYIFVD